MDKPNVSRELISSLLMCVSVIYLSSLLVMVFVVYNTIDQDPPLEPVESSFAHFGAHALPHSGPVKKSSVIKPPTSRPGTATMFKYDSHVSYSLDLTFVPFQTTR